MMISESVRLLGNGHFNLYLAGKEKKVLLECAVSGVVPAVDRQMDDTGGAGDVGRLVVMHAHFDHVCGLPGLLGVFPGAGTAASGKAADVLSRPKVIAQFFREDKAMTGCLRGMDGKDNSAEDAEETGLPPEKLKIGHIIQDKEMWPLGPGPGLQFYSAPGHSPCSLMAYCPQEEVLFSSDSAGFPVDRETIFPIFFESYRNYVLTIEKMLDLPVSVLAGAHEEVISGRSQVREYLQSALDWAERTRDWVIRTTNLGGDQEKLAGDVFERFYRGALRIYTKDNIMACSRLIVKRALESRN